MIYYIDLFCGIGGFHQAMDRVGKARGEENQCLFAADNDIYASNIYKKNYRIEAYYNLKEETTHTILMEKTKDKELDFLFAGFPCQPFSKAGNQEGFNNKTKGTLFFEIEKIIRSHNPKFVLLENVRNLMKHDKGNTWQTINASLNALGYNVDYIIMSPNEIPNKKIPALRDRIFIMGYRADLDIEMNKFFLGKCFKKNKTSIYKYKNPSNGLASKYFDKDVPSDLPKEKQLTIEMWNDLYQMIKKEGKEMISPLWPHYFKCDLIQLSAEPRWKQKLIKKNIDFYEENKTIYDKWYLKYKDHFNSITRSDQKFEWNAGTNIDNAWEGIIQFRPSGVRVKKPDFIPTLVAITQTPILGKEKRFMKPEEMARLYGFKSLKFGEQPLKETYKQLGNTVSVDVVEFLINHMLDTVIQ